MLVTVASKHRRTLAYEKGNGKPHDKLPTPPQPLHDAQLVQRDGGEEDFGRVDVAQWPGQQAPPLAVLEQVVADGEAKVGFRVRRRDQHRRRCDVKDECFGD